MDREKVSSVMDAIAERMLRECEKDRNAEQTLLLAKALNELNSIRAEMISGS